MKRFAITGSNCFTGSHFVDALLADPQNEVLGISRSPEKGSLYLPYKSQPEDAQKRFQFHQMDLAKKPEAVEALLDQFQPDVVIHVAALSEVALSHYHPLEYFEVNTVGTVQLASRLREKKYIRRFLHISSAEIYGPCPHAIPENAPLNPSTPYAVSKAAADFYLLTLRKNFNFPVTLIRSTNVYGKHQQLFKIIPRAAIYLRQGKTIELHGGGTAVKSFIHIRDVIRGALMTLKASSPSAIYHLSTDNPASVADLVRLVCEKMGRSFEKSAKQVGERLGQDARYLLDCSHAQKELGWKPEIGFDQGVQETIDWINTHWNAILKESLEYIHQV